MNTKNLSILLVGGIAAATSPLAAQDKPGAQDHPALKRYQDSVIFQYSAEAFGSYRLALGRALNPSVSENQGRTVEKEESIEGRVTRISYLAPAGRSTLEIFRNYQQELAGKGFETLFAAEGDATGYYFCKRYEGIHSQIFDYNNKNSRYVAARRGGLTVAVFVTEFHMGLSGGLKPVPGQALIQVDVIEGAAMEQRMVVVSAEKMASSIGDTGRIALYGICFDFDKADIRPESAPTIEQMAALLRGNPALKLLVVGHTDNVGGFDYNLELSRRRAAAVVRDLVERHGIGAARLAPMGASYMAPVASNRTEEGRAKNRRVELVEM